jgi:hypothetical protein
MKLLRWFAAGLVVIVAGLLGLVGVILSVTLILLPLGIPVLMLARRMFALAGRMVVPRAVRHPVDELDKAGDAAAGKLKRKMRKGAKSGRDSAAGVGEAAPGRGKSVVKSGRKSKASKAVTKPARGARRVRKRL